MINLEYDENIGHALASRMPMWNKFNELIRSNSNLVNNKILHLAHDTVKYKLEAAYFHKVTLVKSYYLKSSNAKTLQVFNMYTGQLSPINLSFPFSHSESDMESTLC
jgi:hypothetical protein